MNPALENFIEVVEPIFTSFIERSTLRERFYVPKIDPNFHARVPLAVSLPRTVGHRRAIFDKIY